MAVSVAERLSAVGTANAMHTINPEMICFAGGMTAAGPAFLDLIRRYARELVFELPAENTRIEFAALGGDAGFIGAAGCAKCLLLARSASEG